MKHYLIIFLAVISTSLFVGCDTEEELYRPNFATFEGENLEVTVTENSSATLDVSVYTGNISDSDRTFSIEVDESSTVDAAAYSVPSTVTVPGGSNEATFTVEVSDTNIDNTGETLVLNLVDEDGSVIEGEPVTINIIRFCPIDIEDYVDTAYAGTGSWSEIFGYTTEVEIFRNEEGELMINGLVFQWIEGWWGEVIVNNEPVRIEIDTETGAITIPEQFYVETTYEGEPQPAYSIKGTGRINSCAGEMIIRPVLVQDGAEIDPVSFGGVPFLETIYPVSDEDTGDGSEEDGSEEDGAGEDGSGEDGEDSGDGEA